MVHVEPFGCEASSVESKTVDDNSMLLANMLGVLGGLPTHAKLQIDILHALWHADGPFVADMHVEYKFS